MNGKVEKLKIPKKMEGRGEGGVGMGLADSGWM